MKNKVVSLVLVVVLVFSCSLGSFCEVEKDLKEITLSMYCNISQKKYISGIYSQNVFYVSSEDFCEVSGGEISEANDKYIKLTFHEGIRHLKIDHDSQYLTDNENEGKHIPLPVLEKEGKHYYSLLHLLRYMDISVSVEKDAETQIKIYVPYTLLDAFAEFKKNLSCYYAFDWGEVAFQNNNDVEKQLKHSGIVTLINRDSNIFRMALDPKGIEREEIEDAIVSIITNEGVEYLNEDYNTLEMLNIANDEFQYASDIGEFFLEIFKEDAPKEVKEFLNKTTGPSADAIGFTMDVINAFDTMMQFNAITVTQRDLLENTILKYPEDSLLLCGEWKRILNAATNVNNRAKDAFENGHEAGFQIVSKAAYGMLDQAVGVNPISLAWNGAVTITKTIPFFNEMIKKDVLIYNAYLCSMLMYAANEILSNAVNEFDNGGYLKQPETQYEHCVKIKSALVLQLKAVLTTRTSLINSGTLKPELSRDMLVKCGEISKLLNKVENCKIVLFGIEPRVEEDLTWMEDKLLTDEPLYDNSLNNKPEPNNKSITASGECGDNGDNVTWILYDDGEFVIIGNGKMEDYYSDDAPWHRKYRHLINTVKIESNVTSIGNNAFRGCYRLSEIIIGNDVLTIGYEAFYDCGFTEITIPGNVNSIDNRAFSKCKELKTVKINNGVKSIGFGTFSDCDSLISVTIPGSLTNIESEAFNYCNSLTSIVVDNSNPVYSSDNGILFNKDKSELILYPAGKTETNYTIPDSVTRVGDSAFSWCENIVNVTINDNVTSLGECSFDGCTKLNSITISKSVTNIEYGAFLNCTNLSSVYYTGTEQQWSNIKSGGCNNQLYNATVYWNS